MGQKVAQAGSPPHRSHLTAIPERWSWFMCPNGQAMEHRPQPMQRPSSTVMAPVASLRLRASTGQTLTQAASLH